MAKLPFVDKYGRITYSNPDEAFVREHTYIILATNSEFVCIYNQAEQLFTLPTDSDLQINTRSVTEFSTFAYLTENKHPIKELQNYKVYAIEKTDLPDKSFQWCKFDDILLHRIAFDATKLTGIKNLYVRMKNL